MINYGLPVYLDTLDVIDPEEMRSWRNSFHVWNYTRQNDLLPKGGHSKWLDAQLSGQDKTSAMYAIVCADRLSPVGVCGLTNIDLINRRAEFSLYIDPLERASGLGTAALKTVVSHGFNSFGLHSIWGESFEYNLARLMFTRVGFTEDGVRRSFYYRNGKFVDAYLYCLLRKEWDSHKEFETCRTQFFS